MDKRTILAIGISLAIFAFWTKFVMVPPPPEPEHATSAEGGKPADAPAVAAKPEDAAGSKPAVDAPAAGTAPATPLARQPETFTTIDVPGRYHATLSSWGAALHDFVLENPQYKERAGAAGGEIPIDLVAPKDAPLPYSITFPDSGFVLPPDADFQAQPMGPDPHVRSYTWESGGVKVTKRYQFFPGTYEIEIGVTVENHGDKALPATMRLSLRGQQDPEAQANWLHPQVVQTEGLCSTGKVKRGSLSALLKEPIEVAGPVRVIAIDRKYFVLAAAIVPNGQERCRVEATKSGRITATLTTGAVSVAPGSKTSWSMLAFGGPKVVTELDAVRVGGADAHLGDVMNYGFTEVFVRPMLWVLKTIQRGLHNWGIAIILLTVLIKLITWWPTAQSMKSAQAMARLKPEMDKLKEKYGDDKQRMNQEVMALYQKHKINPLGGCLPMLIQMPVYFALYSMLGNSVELYHASLGFWIHDLTGPDPFFVLPLTTGALMFLQQKLSPTPPDPSQKTMMTIMPVMYTGMSIFLPAGLTLYILTNSALSIVQQRLSTPNRDASAGTGAKKKADK